MEIINKMDAKELENLTEQEMEEKLCEYYIETLNQYRNDKFQKIDGKTVYKILEPFFVKLPNGNCETLLCDPTYVSFWTFGEFIDLLIFGIPIVILCIIATLKSWSLTFSASSILSLTVIAFGLLFLFRINDLYNYLLNFDCKIGSGEKNFNILSLNKLFGKFTVSIGITNLLAVLLLVGRIALEIYELSTKNYLITVILLTSLAVLFFFLTKKPTKSDLAKYTQDSAYIYLISYASLKIEEFCACSCVFWGLVILGTCSIDQTNAYFFIPCVFLILWTRKRVDYQLLIKTILLKYQKSVTEN